MASNDDVMDFEFYEELDAKISKDLAKETDVDMKKRIRDEMENETKKLQQMQTDVKFKIPVTEVTTSKTFPTLEEKVEADARSVYVGNVDYGATDDELRQHFNRCGPIKRVSIMKHKSNGRPRGFAYVEFFSMESVEVATKLNQSSIRGREIRVNLKRTNHPGYTLTNRGRGRGVNRARAQAQQQRAWCNWTAPSANVGVNTQPRKPTKKFSKRFAPY